MPKIKDRVIVDTNLWISFLLSKDYGKLDKLFNAENLILLFSRELLDEFVEVARRPKFKKYFSITDLNELLTEIHSRAEFIDVTSVVNLCRDEKDDFLLALAKDGKADFLITGDNDLLELEKFEKTNILTMANYLQKK
ncbi:MAG TPA: putative toxin-antitoxin system toxin component, PIN family [Flavobacterium sp.]|jgi:putative PIN family toxin of toxin-antitoxin system|nr:putative toxin-antitoxin system toxin component, PIN family [Flavobacterium sp.]HQX04726.1 putative toxin-antitoxin system toxin component, PIN family [Flavobacterium sp.]HRZ33135.1 putative toxin-antitoxin system toxin component, PIN family [Flavobacterium sp.]HRZ75635.1 putative toxin-antitoxin system toxin component, PIN family [Flavobacterium sp.]